LFTCKVLWYQLGSNASTLLTPAPEVNPDYQIGYVPRASWPELEIAYFNAWILNSVVSCIRTSLCDVAYENGQSLLKASLYEMKYLMVDRQKEGQIQRSRGLMSFEPRTYPPVRSLYVSHTEHVFKLGM
jgi:hypothetical protein